jgi:hypothetical protein
MAKWFNLLRDRAVELAFEALLNKPGEVELPAIGFEYLDLCENVAKCSLELTPEIKKKLNNVCGVPLELTKAGNIFLLASDDAIVRKYAAQLSREIWMDGKEVWGGYKPLSYTLMSAASLQEVAALVATPKTLEEFALLACASV